LHFLRYILVLILCSTWFLLTAQPTAFVTGVVRDEGGAVLQGVSIIILGRQTGAVSSDSGTFKIKCPVNRAFALLFSHAGYVTQKKNFLLKANEEERTEIVLISESSSLAPVTITREQDRLEAGRISLDPRNSVNLPSPTGGVESMIKVFVGSNNELTSQYSVRGGNYDENLVYVNDFEVFRPYLVRSGQQEALSFINPELARNVVFYNGGFQAKYGDKMSSVLDVQYRKPQTFSGSAYVSLIEQGMHIEGISRNKKFTFLAGVRNRNNRNVLKRQETQGNYIPSSSDVQALFTYRLARRSSIELLANLSRTRFRFYPQFSQLTSSVFSPFFSANLGLDVYFEGSEKDDYRTQMVGVSFLQQPSPRVNLKWMVSRFTNHEREGIDITGAYLFGEREFDKSKPEFGVITNPLGAGIHQTYARNDLDISVWNASHRGSLDLGSHYLQWGQTVERQKVSDNLHEWEYQDSAGYALPYNPNDIVMSAYAHANASFHVWRASGYLQNSFTPRNINGLSVQGGVRYNYNDLNSELLVSPRASVSWKPQRWKNDIVIRVAAGLYHQPPFYRELRNPAGELNKELKAQKSYQLVAGFDYQFMSRKRPFRLSAEAYFKNLWQVVPYDMDNVRLRYAARNNAKAYAAGVELRLFGELVKDAESWISVGFMRTRENLEQDFYYNYTLDSLGNVLDSSQHEGGWFRRPTDRLFTFGLFLQDYLATNKNFKVYLNLLYGSNMPYNIPNSIKYRNALMIDPYIRVDIGFSALLVREKKIRNVESVWLNLEVFNLIDRDNTISYQLIKDFSNTRFAVPNRLTPRLLNLKAIVRFSR
jgi:hypothetical protein